ncbi:MAG: Crp/Fnr family transcriptional regulator [Chitinophagaceae bacterium]
MKSCFVCRNSSTGWLPAIESNKKNLFFKKGQTIFEEDMKVKGIYFLYSGKAKVHKLWGPEKELILKFAKPSDIIGYRGLGNEKVYPVTATALEPVVVCFFDLPFFEETLKVNNQLTYQLMKFYANELQEAESRMRDLAHMDVKGRLAQTLLQLKKRFGLNKEGFINITLKRQDIASYTGTTYETLYRTIIELEKDKIIRLTGGKIAILKEAKLEVLNTYKK